MIPRVQRAKIYLKNRILVQAQGEIAFQSAGILLYFEELKRELNAEIGPKDIFEMNFYTLKRISMISPS